MFGWMCSLQRLRVFFFIYSLLITTDLQAAFTAPDSQETQSMYFKAGSPWMKPVYAFKYRLLPAV